MEFGNLFLSFIKMYKIPRHFKEKNHMNVFCNPYYLQRVGE